MSSIRLQVKFLQVPLKSPYHLSFKSLTHFETFLIFLDDGEQLFWGETTSLEGYSPESTAIIQQNINFWITQAAGSLAKLSEIVTSKINEFPFSCAPILTALEKRKNSIKSIEKQIPLVGIISSENFGEIKQQLSNSLAAGHKTIKVKIKGNWKTDSEKVKFIRQHINQSNKLRLDANQGYTYDNAVRFIDKIGPNQIELLEQPFKPHQWNDMVRLSQVSSIPLMLDESIWKKEDIIKTAELKCAAYVKLKLFKHVTPTRTLHLIKIAQDLGLKIIFGNGVQTDFGCHDEAMIYNKARLDTASESNGFLKQTTSLFSNPLTFSKGNVVTKGNPIPNDEIINQYSITSADYNFINDIV